MLLHFTFLADLFNQTPSQLLWEASSHMLQLMRECCSYKYLAQGFNTAAQDSNPSSHSLESNTLPPSHCALQVQEVLPMFFPLMVYSGLFVRKIT